MTFEEGDCNAATTGDGDFDITEIPVAPITGASRYEVNHTVRFSGLSEDTWFVVVVKAGDGECATMFPVFAANRFSAEENATADALMDGNVGEEGVLALGATNALYFDTPPSPE